MHVMVATDGKLDPLASAEVASRLAGSDGSVTVMTVVEVPRTLLTAIRNVYGEDDAPQPIDQSIETSGHTTPRPHLSLSWPGDDAIINRYVSDQLTSRTEALLAALADRGIEPSLIALESEKPVDEILGYALANRVDVICIGTHGEGMFDGLLGSTSTKIARKAHCAVMLIRS